LSRLVDDLLLLARLDSGAPRRAELVDIAALVGSPDGSDTPGVDLFVEGDPVALRRMLDNLVVNARRYANGRVDVAAHRDGADVVITVDDDGPGIPSGDRERVFERWLRLDDSRGRDDGGAGLGLAIVRSIAQAHGGDAELDTSQLGGLRAVVRLPATTPARTSSEIRR
ncbi:MAG: ATP-binding protein, partial [Acidothermaceae bacterium]